MTLPSRTDEVMKKHHREIFISLLLAAAVLVVYAQVRNFELVRDDDYTVMSYADVHTAHGVDVSAAFTAGPSCFPYRVPLAMLSHMLDLVLFGHAFGLHHMVNVFIHIINTLLLFYAFRFATGDMWKSAGLAALFAVHPLNVEPVSWLPCRVTLLSGFFFILTLLCYFRYAKRPTKAGYALVLLFYVAGLLAKPEIIYLPFVLLLMDYWPLGRWRGMAPAYNPCALPGQPGLSGADLLKEKTPLFLVALAGAGLATYLYIKIPVRGMIPKDSLSPLVTDILSGVPLSYLGYLLKILLPFNLSVFSGLDYAPPGAWESAGAMALLSLITGWVVYAGRRRPYMVIGWLWFLLTMALPVVLSGLFRHSLVHRYAYLPGVGIVAMLVWGGHDIVKHNRYLSAFFVAALLALVLGFMSLSWRQAGIWENTATLYESLLKSGRRSAKDVYTDLGNIMLGRGAAHQAIVYYRKALEQAPADARLHHGIGLAHAQKGAVSAALAAYRRALALKPDFALAHNNMANLLADTGQIDEAIDHYRAALAADPGQPEFYNNLATTLAQSGRIPEAIEHLEKALAIDPEYQTAIKNMARLRVMESSGE